MWGGSDPQSHAPSCFKRGIPPSERPDHVPERSWGGGGGGQGTWAAQKHSEAGYGRPVDGGVWTAKTVKRPPPHPAQPQHTNYWAPRTRKRHQQEHRPQRPTESSDPTQQAKGRTGDRPGPRKGATTRRNVAQGGGRRSNKGHAPCIPPPPPVRTTALLGGRSPTCTISLTVHTEARPMAVGYMSGVPHGLPLFSFGGGSNALQTF